MVRRSAVPFTLTTASTRPRPKPKDNGWKPEGPFRFFDMPPELRNRVYEYALLVPRTLDLDPYNHKRIAPRLDLLQTCRQMYEEAYHVFYSEHTFRIFPTHPAFLNSKAPLIMTLPRHYRRVMTSLELRLGPGWGKPPKCQSLRPKLGLKDCIGVRHLKVFVEVDPSNDIFKGYRVNDSFYTAFSTGMLEGVFQQVPSISAVEFDAYPSVKQRDPLMTALLNTVYGAGRMVIWGPERGWSDDQQDEEPKVCHLEQLESAFALVTVSSV